MNWLRNPIRRGATAVLLSAALWLTGGAGPDLWQKASMGGQLYAWWGTMYPEFCFEKTPESSGDPAEQKPILTFWFLEFLEKQGK